MDKQCITKKRKADFYTSVILLGLSVAMLAETLTFPMADSYGGVQNVWYVSPALFPMLVAGGLIVLSLVLMRRAVVDGGARRAWAERSHLLLAWRDERFLRLVVIMASIAIFVYGLVSYVDFFLASVLFLGAFITPFYIDRKAFLAPSLLSLWGAGLFAFVVERDGIVSGTWLDMIVLASYVLMILTTRVYSRADSGLIRKWRITVLVSILAPLVLVPSFKFGLLVPLPVEGLAIDAMETVVRGLTAPD